MDLLGFTALSIEVSAREVSAPLFRASLF